MFAMLVGAIAPIPFWLWQRRFPPAEIYQLTRHAQWSYTRAARKWDQLRELIHRWVYLPCVFFIYSCQARFVLFLFFSVCWVG